jgi:hypothetical protein
MPPPGATTPSSSRNAIASSTHSSVAWPRNWKAPAITAGNTSSRTPVTAPSTTCRSGTRSTTCVGGSWSPSGSPRRCGPGDLALALPHRRAQGQGVGLGHDPQLHLDLAGGPGGLHPQGGEPQQPLHEAAVDLDLLDPRDVQRPVVAAQHPLRDPQHLAVEGVVEALPGQHPRDQADDADQDQRDQHGAAAGREGRRGREQEGLDQLPEVDAEHHRGRVQTARLGEAAGLGHDRAGVPVGPWRGRRRRARRRLRRHRGDHPRAARRLRRRGPAARRARAVPARPAPPAGRRCPRRRPS